MSLRSTGKKLVKNKRVAVEACGSGDRNSRHTAISGLNNSVWEASENANLITVQVFILRNNI